MKKIMCFIILVLFLFCINCNEDGGIGQTNAEQLDKLKLKIDWRPQCNYRHGRMNLLETIALAPYQAEVLDILTCKTIKIKLRGKCYLITRGFRSHSWSEATC